MKMCLLHVWKDNIYQRNQLRHDSFSEKYQGTPGQVPIAFNGIFPSLYSFSSYPTCRVSLEMRRAIYQEFISVSEYFKP